MASREDKHTLRCRWPLGRGLDVDVVFGGERPPNTDDYDLLIEYLETARKTAQSVAGTSDRPQDDLSTGPDVAQ